MRFTKLLSKKEIIFFGIISIIAILGMALIYLKQWNSPPIRSDGIGYYAYLPSVFIHNDISMNKFMTERAEHFNEETPDSWSGINKLENGNYLDKYSMGEAILMLPFFLIAHILTLIFQLESNGFTLFYQLIVGASGGFYMVFGLFILSRFLKKYFKPRVVYISLLIILFGTNLFHYGTYDSTFSHAFSFFLFALFLLYFDKWRNVPTSFKLTTYVGLISGFIFLVRPTNLLFPAIFVAVFALQNIRKLTSWKNLIVIALLTLLVFIPQILYWKAVSGNFIVNPYVGEGFDLTKPETLNVLFSIRKGLFFWSPILFLSIAGFFLMKDKLRKYLLPILLFLVINTYLISTWHHWPYGGGFGHRAFVECIALLSIPLTAFFSYAYHLESKIKRNVTFVLIAVLVTLSAIFMLQYWRGMLKPDGTTFETFIGAFVNQKDFEALIYYSH